MPSVGGLLDAAFLGTATNATNFHSIKHDINCNGNEEHFKQCQMTSFNNSYCTDPVHITCQGIPHTPTGHFFHIICTLQIGGLDLIIVLMDSFV